MRVVITSATQGETLPAREVLAPLYSGAAAPLQLQFHESGVGMLASAFSLSKLILEDKPDLVLQAGIAGSFTNSLPLGAVVAVSSESLADTGVEENGAWRDLFDMGFSQENGMPFENRTLPNTWLNKYNLLHLPEVVGVTVNRISTGTAYIHRIREKYNPAVESMEGACLHYVCRQMATPFLQIRSISNETGERDKTKWQIREAITALNNSLIAYIDRLSKEQQKRSL